MLTLRLVSKGSFSFYFFFINYLCTTLSFKTSHIQLLLLQYSFRIKFIGKGYRLFVLSRNSVIFNFNYAHITLRYFFQSSFIVFNKTSLIFFGLNYFVQTNVGRIFVQVRPRNIFTGRGIRLRASLIRKKDGKISLYR